MAGLTDAQRAYCKQIADKAPAPTVELATQLAALLPEAPAEQARAS